MMTEVKGRRTVKGWLWACNHGELLWLSNIGNRQCMNWTTRVVLNVPMQTQETGPIWCKGSRHWHCPSGTRTRTEEANIHLSMDAILFFSLPDSEVGTLYPLAEIDEDFRKSTRLAPYSSAGSDGAQIWPAWDGILA